MWRWNNFTAEPTCQPQKLPALQTAGSREVRQSYLHVSRERQHHVLVVEM